MAARMAARMVARMAARMATRFAPNGGPNGGPNGSPLQPTSTLDDPVQPNAQSLIRLHAECALEHFSTMSTFVYIPLRKYLLRDDALFLPHVVIPLVHR